MTTLIISSSLNESSKSRILANSLLKDIEGSELIDLRDYPLPLCDAGSAYSHESLPILKEKIESATGIIVAAPVYNYNTNAALKNLIELTGKSWTEKLVAFVCAAGGKNSYFAPLTIMNSLMLDFRCFILPRYVYATSSDFNEEGTELVNEDIKERLNKLKDEFLKVSSALK